MKQACTPEFLKGVEEFNQRQFFRCHETLEKLWQEQQPPEKDFTQGIIQIAVGYHHLSRNNWLGARKLFRRGLERILPFKPVHLGLNVTQLSDQVAGTLVQLENPEGRKTGTLEFPKILFIQD